MKSDLVSRFATRLSVLAVGGVMLVGARDVEAAKARRHAGLQPVSELVAAERDAYAVDAKAAKAKVGEHAALRVELTTKNGFHLNQEYPHKLTVDAVPAGLKVEKMELVRGDATVAENALRFDVDAVAEKAGRYTVQAKLKTSVCDEKQCILRSEKLTLTLVAR